MTTAGRTTFRRLPRPLAMALLAVPVVAPAATAATAGGQSAEQVMEKMAELEIEFVGIATDIPDRQNLGRRYVEAAADERNPALPDAGDGLVVYAWDVERTPDDRAARERLLSVQHLQAAGIPAIPGSSPDFETGAIGSDRYRLGGVLTGIDIRGEGRYEVRVNLDWQLYDARASSVIWEGSSRAMSRGAALGDRGESNNVLLNATLQALDSVLDDEIPEAIERSEEG